MGVGLHSRFSSRNIINHISDEMRSKLCKSLVSDETKISLLVDESTTVSDKAAMVIYLKCQLVSEEEPQYVFLSLTELQNGETSGGLYESLMDCLNDNGLSEQYLSNNLIGFTSDGPPL